jgi:transcriptional regulator GlxA family with amidase domain/YHS domain-containing protein
LKAPADGGPIVVAFVVSEGAVVIDFTGPWEVFQDAVTPGSAGFQLYTVSATKEPIRTSGGMRIVPDYTFATAPAPRIVVVPAQHGYKDPALQEAMLDWLRKSSEKNDLTMSVCAGAFTLAASGLLDGKSATTIHHAWRYLERQYPKINVERGVRFVEDGRLATSAGLSSGIDLALHVVERYFGREAAEKTAFEMEYQGTGWKDRNSNANYVTYMAARESTAVAEGMALDPVCGMTIGTKDAPSSTYKGKTYYFCSRDDKAQFDGNPQQYAK